MVIIKTNDASPLSWPLGRIIELYPGTDNVVRVAKAMTEQGEFTRQVVKYQLLRSSLMKLLRSNVRLRSSPLR
ncbi:Integrase catalytic domain-containing protein [Aphis craccivora]|uniref:Integrase catalytic domain-containing protein n=1 Tax=Aphis craccivora TaxID=307492 RepID=A0A6G0VYP4_APHCR|nr:Integrase catalytic domain-containing protein [Aphis craccivora]